MIRKPKDFVVLDLLRERPPIVVARCWETTIGGKAHRLAQFAPLCPGVGLTGPELRKLAVWCVRAAAWKRGR